MIRLVQKRTGGRVFEAELPLSLEQFERCRKIVKPIVERTMKDEPLISGLALSIGNEALKQVPGLPKLDGLDTNILVHMCIGKRVTVEEIGGEL